MISFFRNNNFEIIKGKEPFHSYELDYVLYKINHNLINIKDFYDENISK